MGLLQIHATIRMARLGLGTETDISVRYKMRIGEAGNGWAGLGSAASWMRGGLAQVADV
jgi:hypothetical protein